MTRIKRMQGIIMMEVLISIVILSFGILGLASLQIYSVRSAQSSYWRSVASDLANDMADRIRANRSPLVATMADSTPPVDSSGNNILLTTDYARLACAQATALTPGLGGNASCTTYTPVAGEVDVRYAKADVQQWLNTVFASLPNASAMICRGTDTTIGTGVSAIYDQSNASYSTTRCLASSAATYASAPYMIRIYWSDKNAESGAVQMFATTFQ